MLFKKKMFESVYVDKKNLLEVLEIIDGLTESYTSITYVMNCKWKNEPDRWTVYYKCSLPEYYEILDKLKNVETLGFKG